MRPRPILAAFAVSLLAAACQGPPADFDPHQRYRATVEQGRAVATVRPHTAETPLGPTDRAVVADLAREYLRRGAGPVTVTVEHGGDAAQARGFADQIAAAFAEDGVGAVVVASTRSAAAGTVAEIAVPPAAAGTVAEIAVPPAAAGTVAEIAVPLWVAKVPECGTWSEGIGADHRNQNTANFGCAVVRNIGLMVANPADLERARPASGRSGARAEDVLGKYGQGKPTAAKAEDAKPSITLSTVGTK